MSRSIPETMQAIVVERHNGPASALRLADLATPSPGAGQVRIKVHAAGLNRSDILQRGGAYKIPAGASEVMGLEVAGEVVTGAGRWMEGDQVCALVAGGGYAQYVAVDARHVLPIPRGFDFVQAAGLPETVFTVYANVFEHGALQPGETLLVHGANSGVGMTAIQMGKAHGAKVIATVRSAKKAAAARTCGADVAIDVTTEDFAEVCGREGGVDVILEMVGGDYLRKDLTALNANGRVVFVGNMGGDESLLPVMQMMMKRATITGSTLRPRSNDEKARLAKEIERVVWPWIEAGKLSPQVDKVFPLAEAGAAQAYLDSGTHIGKVVLTP
jgi:putative PIG3 family NAD(P)H quinone oxidoreductase